MSVVCPNWEPMGYNMTGSAPWLDVQTVGWNAVKIGGNVGIGDGSYRTLKYTSTPDTKYADTGSEMMAADVSMAPLDISRMSGYIPHRPPPALLPMKLLLRTIPPLRMKRVRLCYPYRRLMLRILIRTCRKLPTIRTLRRQTILPPSVRPRSAEHGTERSVSLDTDGAAGQRPAI